MTLPDAVRAIRGLHKEGKVIRRVAWPPGWHVRAEFHPRADAYGRQQVLVLVGPGSPTRTTSEDFCPAIVDVLAEDWEVQGG